MNPLDAPDKTTDLLMRGGGYAVASIFIALALLVWRAWTQERKRNWELQEKFIALAIENNATMIKLQGAVGSFKELLERMV